MGKIEGFIAAAIAVVGFGSNFIPCKRYDMGDGIFFNVVMCLGIWCFGLWYETIVFPSSFEFHPFALLGGLIWCTGNVLTVPIIKLIGLSLGIAIWGATALFVGWLTGKFGLLGTPKDESINNTFLNYIGVSIVLISIICFIFVKPVRADDYQEIVDKSMTELSVKSIFKNSLGAQRIESRSKTKSQPNLLHISEYRRSNWIDDERNRSWVDDLNTGYHQFVGVILSLFSGTCYGLCFCPIQYVIHHQPQNSFSNRLEDYTFCHFCGILISSIVYFFIYVIYIKNRPQVNKKGIAPALISGIVWAVAQTAFFTADDQDNLGTDTCFPIVASSPQVVASLWGVFLFREIQGKRNLMMLCVAICINFLGVAFIALSKF